MRQSQIFEALEPSFGMGQLEIEACYENHESNWAHWHPGIIGLDRFLRIAANIIHNHGKFVPDNDPSDAKFTSIVKRYSYKGRKRAKVAA